MLGSIRLFKQEQCDRLRSAGTMQHKCNLIHLSPGLSSQKYSRPKIDVETIEVTFTINSTISLEIF